MYVNVYISLLTEDFFSMGFFFPPFLSVPIFVPPLHVSNRLLQLKQSSFFLSVEKTRWHLLILPCDLICTST